MNRLGSGDNGSFTFLDMITIISFIVGLQNLDLNITQDDLQKETERLDKTLRQNVTEIHAHLEDQDNKIEQIIDMLGEKT